MIIELKHQIKNDEYTQYLYEAYDIMNKAETTVKVESNFKELRTMDWNIGVIYGGSGTGKTTLLKTFGDLSPMQFDGEKSLISNFTFCTPKEATMLLSAMGLASVPTWLRPFHCLSNGEQYRAELAYKVGIAKQDETILIDEYTSVVDRDVAKAMSNALRKYIRRTGKKIILNSCHFDIMEWLIPDWTYSPLKGHVEKHDSRRQSRPDINLQVFRCRYETWDIFKQHHYLTEDLNKSAKCFLTMWNNKPCAFSAVLPFPHGHIKDGFRMSRTVVLPDYQGMGIGSRISDYIASIYAAEGKTMYVKTSNPALWHHRDKSPDWFMTTHIDENKVKDKKWFEDMRAGDAKGILGYRQAVTKSYKWIGPPSTDSTDIMTFNAEAYKDVAQNQISLF